MELNTETSIDPHDGDADVVVTGQDNKTTDTPAFKASDDGNIVEHGGRKYVREEALHGERTRAQGYANTLKQLEPLMPEFEQFLEQKRGGRAATVDRATRNVNSDYSEDELTGYAITRGYYDGDNKPDLKRASDDLDIMTAIADRRAGRVVKPIADASARDRAAANVRRAASQQFADGEPIADQKYLDAAFNSVPDEVKADPNVSNILQVVAAGLQYLDERRTGRGRSSRREPVFREGSGNRSFEGGGELDALDRAAARARGKTPEQWSKMSKSVGSNAALGGTVLEDI